MHFVAQLVVVDARDALGDLQVGAVPQPVAVAAADARLVGEVRGLDDQRVALPVPARIAEILADA